MKMLKSRKVVIILMLALIFGSLIAAAICNLRNGHKDTADFLMKTAASLGTLAAVICALFRDFLLAACDPIRVIIEVPNKDNDVFDGDPVHKSAYCHHLRVKNQTPHRAIVNCRVWLKEVEVQQEPGKWESGTISPVPRLMDWAPSEFSKDARTFTAWQVFDLGKTFGQNAGFEFTVNSSQGGNFQKAYAAGKRLRAIFFVTADNYTKPDEFAFEIDIPHPRDPAENAKSIVKKSESIFRDGR